MTSLFSWKFRNLTPLGRITVIKTLKQKESESFNLDSTKPVSGIYN